MDLTVGAIIEGKVKSITNFGAFIALPENRTGMVHISEVANVKVMVIAINPAGKINLSIKRLEPKPAPRPRSGDRPRQSRPAAQPVPTQATVAKSSDQLFEERLKQFMSESDSKISSLRQYSDHRTKSRRR